MVYDNGSAYKTIKLWLFINWEEEESISCFVNFWEEFLQMPRARNKKRNQEFFQTDSKPRQHVSNKEW